MATRYFYEKNVNKIEYIGYLLQKYNEKYYKLKNDYRSINFLLKRYEDRKDKKEMFESLKIELENIYNLINNLRKKRNFYVNRRIFYKKQIEEECCINNLHKWLQISDSEINQHPSGMKYYCRNCDCYDGINNPLSNKKYYDYMTIYNIYP